MRSATGNFLSVLHGISRRLRRYYALIKVSQTVDVELADHAGEAIFLRYLHRRFFGVPLIAGAGVLTLPADPKEYCRGRPKQALRTNRSRANAMGLQVRRLKPEEFPSIAEHILKSEHGLDHIDKLLDEPFRPYMETWIGSSSDGDVIAVARFAVGVRCAVIKCFVATQNRELSIVRWKMAADIFESFAARGIRHVVAGSVMEPSSGLTYYQDRLGFVPCRITLCDVATHQGWSPQSHSPARRQLPTILCRLPSLLGLLSFLKIESSWQAAKPGA